MGAWYFVLERVEGFDCGEIWIAKEVVEAFLWESLVGVTSGTLKGIAEV